ncbi:MAG: transglutaminase family protein [Planctomycetaceae bacterium]
MLLAMVGIGGLGVPSSRAIGSEAEVAPKELSVTELSKQINQSLVIVRATGRDGRVQGHGTGFIISEDGLIATARHVIGDRRQVIVELPDGKTAAATHVHGTHESIDVAIVRIDAKGLTALPLSTDDDHVAGQPVVAVGHPGSRTNTTVSGIVAGTQEIDGINMLQLAMPVERGSSGEPVVNRFGQVIGVVTLKSTQEANLGFAVPIRHFRDLLEDPAPIPMSRWITIGALDPKRWEIVFDAGWSQRAGRIQVDGPGRSFGGRSLCLNQQAVPSLPYEVQVDVKLSDERGAAGLVFHADGGDQHYGFYPSNGNIRLTRFTGPDVNSWEILHNEPHTAYRSGDWNTFRVRLAEDGITCWLNQQLVLKSDDTELLTGRAGLATFRGTAAEFRRFKVAEKLPAAAPDHDGQATFQTLLEGFPPDRPASPELIQKMQPMADFSSSLLEQKARELEERAKQLRLLADDVHAARVRKQIQEALGRTDSDPTATSDAKPDLLKAALLLAVLDNQELDPDPYLERIDQLADEVRMSFPQDATEAQRLEAMDRMLFEEYGFRGSRYDYYTTSNSYLNEVIDDREGLPITLCVMYMELARRLDLNVVGLGLPGHYVVKYVPSDEKSSEQIIDVFHKGKRITKEEADDIIRSRGYPVREDFFAGQSADTIIQRMLINLLNLAEAKRDDQQVLRYLDTLIPLDESAVEFRLKRLEIRSRTHRLAEAIADADWLIDNAADQLNTDRLSEFRARLHDELDRQTGTGGH